MRLSVAVCTRNRASMLRRALASLVACDDTGLGSEWEVIVVDNGSSDDTSETATSFAGALPLRIVHEHHPGLSNARNRAMAAARGSWVLWTDDDATVDEYWLRAYVRAIDEHPHACVLGGPIDVQFEGPAPAWLLAGQRWVDTAFARRDAGDIRDQLSPTGALPFGANFALRRDPAVAFPFDPMLGRHPERPTAGGEEIRVMRDLLEAGQTGFWVPQARVVHHIDPSRQTSAYLRSYFRDIGFAEVLDAGDLDLTSLSRGLACALRDAGKDEALHLRVRLLGPGDQVAYALKSASHAWGRASAYASMIRRTLFAPAGEDTHAAK